MHVSPPHLRGCAELTYRPSQIPVNTVTPATEFANVISKCLIACMKSTSAFMEVLLLSTISNVFSATLACAVWCADPKGVRIWRCATTADTVKKFAHSAEVRTGCRHATDPPTIHSNDNTSNDNVVVLHVLRMDSYKFPPVSYSVAVTRGGEAKQ